MQQLPFYPGCEIARMVSGAPISFFEARHYHLIERLPLRVIEVAGNAADPHSENLVNMIVMALMSYRLQRLASKEVASHFKHNTSSDFAVVICKRLHGNSILV